MSTAIMKIEEKIETTKRELQKLGAMRPGKISRQYRNPKEKKRPFYQISYTYQMKSRSEYLRPEHLAAIQKETANFKRFKKLPLPEPNDTTAPAAPCRVRWSGRRELNPRPRAPKARALPG